MSATSFVRVGGRTIRPLLKTATHRHSQRQFSSSSFTSTLSQISTSFSSATSSFFNSSSQFLISSESKLPSSSSLPISDSLISDAVNSGVVEAAVQVADFGGSINPKYQVMTMIDYIHTMAGIPYWEAIIIASLCVRVLVLPIAIKSLKNAAGMALVRPELEKIQKSMQALGDSITPEQRVIMTRDMKDLFEKYKVNPLRSLLLPFAQFPLFMAFFFALRDMPEYFPDLATGGALWFTSLSIPDPYLLLSVLNSITFLIMIEVGADGIPTQNQGTFKMAMRGFSVLLVPITMTMPASVLLYWNTNNIFSLAQQYVLKQPAVKKYFEIPDPPKEAPELKVANPFKNIIEVVKKEFNTDTEIVDEKKTPSSNTPPPPPVTFSNKPPKKSKK